LFDSVTKFLIIAYLIPFISSKHTVSSSQDSDFKIGSYGVASSGESGGDNGELMWFDCVKDGLHLSFLHCF
jgi:hypothetical protein